MGPVGSLDVLNVYTTTLRGMSRSHLPLAAVWGYEGSIKLIDAKTGLRD